MHWKNSFATGRMYIFLCYSMLLVDAAYALIGTVLVSIKLIHLIDTFIASAIPNSASILATNDICQCINFIFLKLIYLKYPAFWKAGKLIDKLKWIFGKNEF